MSNPRRLELWDKIDAAAKVMLAEMESAARDPDWTDDDIERWDSVHRALSDRPRLTIAECDRLSGRFETST